MTNPNVQVVLWLGLVFFLFQCQNKTAENSVDSSDDENIIQDISEADLPSDFLTFYDSFQNDSAFQVAHIIWPLKGLPDDIKPNGPVPEGFIWKKNEWKIHKPLDQNDASFSQSFANVDDKMVIHKIELTDMQLFAERRFAKLGGDEWFLIFYRGMRANGNVVQ